MFRLSSETEYEGRSEGGIRHLFALDSFAFYDALDEDDQVRQFVLERSEEGGDPGIYETDKATMYEFMARYLAGEYEKREYRLEHSPTHAALLDALEIALARARSGETEFSFEDLDELDFEFDEDGGVEEEGPAN
jgi:hypothetical protein